MPWIRDGNRSKGVSMEMFDKWADRIYSETDVSRSLAISAAGIVGLVVYLATSDAVIAGFSLLVVFPIVRLLVASKYERLKKASERHQKHEETNTTLDALSDGEQAVVAAFVELGGCVMTWGQVNRSSLPSAAIETLMQRELLFTSMTADGMTETFVLNVDVFDAGVRQSRRSITNPTPVINDPTSVLKPAPVVASNSTGA